MPYGSDTRPQMFQGSKTSSEFISVNNTIYMEGHIFKLSWIFMHGHAVGACTVCPMYVHCLLQVCACSSFFRPSPCNTLVIPGGKRSLLLGKGSSRAPSCVRAGMACGRSFLEAQTCRTDSVGFADFSTVYVNRALCLEEWQGRHTHVSAQNISYLTKSERYY